MRKKIIIYSGITLLVALIGFGSGYFFGSAMDSIFKTQSQSNEKIKPAINAVPEPKVIEAAVDEKIPDLGKDDFKIGDICLGATKQQIYRNLGNPVKTATVLDQTLHKKVNVLYYPGIEINLNEQGAAIGITGAAKEYTGPLEISVGMTRHDVIKKMGKPQVDEKDLMGYSSYEDRNYKLSVKTNNDLVISLSVSNIN